MFPHTDHDFTDPLTPTDDVRQYAGKKDLNEVFLTGWQELDDHTHTVIARWPRHHTFYTPTTRGGTLLLLTETIRQSLAITSRLGLAIPAEHRMGWSDISCRIPADVTRPVRPGTLTEPADIELTVTHDTVERRRSGLIRLAAQVRATRHGRPLGDARIHYTSHPPNVYNRIRGAHADARQAFADALPTPPPVTASHVGHTDPANVVLAPDPRADPEPTPHRWTLRADTGNTVLFDHAHDHIPGMVLLEAAQQATQASAFPQSLTPLRLDAVFHRYIELDTPCTITADTATVDDHGHRVQLVHGQQAEQPAFTVTVTSARA